MVNPPPPKVTFAANVTDRWPLTPRTRFALWLSMYEVVRALNSDVIGVLGGTEVEQTDVMSQLPVAVAAQPLPWWGQLLRSGYRLVDALAHGDRDAMEPRTPGEEAFVYLAIEWAPDEMENATLLNGNPDGRLAWQMAHGAGTWQLYESLPSAEELPLPDDFDIPEEERAGVAETLKDFDWPDILPDLTGDADIELAFNPAVDGITDPANPINQYLAVGDYRLAAWNNPFLRSHRHEG